MHGPDDEITATATRVAYENRWMRVREDATRRRDGSTGLCGVVEEPDFVVVVPAEGGVVHLVEQYRYPVRRRCWEFPQGTWDARPGADPVEAARAELAKETGLRAARMTEAGHLFQAYGYATQGCRVFLATGLTPGEAAPEAEEGDLVSHPFALSEAEAMMADGTIKDATTLAAFALPRLRGLL